MSRPSTLSPSPRLRFSHAPQPVRWQGLPILLSGHHPYLATSHFLYQPPSCLHPHALNLFSTRSQREPVRLSSQILSLLCSVPLVASHPAQSENLASQALPLGLAALPTSSSASFSLPCSSPATRASPQTQAVPHVSSCLGPSLPHYCVARSLTTSGVASSERPLLPILTEPASSPPWQSKVPRKGRGNIPAGHLPGGAAVP